MPIDMNALARLGAQIRITELIAEIESMVQAFPGLGKAPAHTASTSEEAPQTRRGTSAGRKVKVKSAWAKPRGETATQPTEDTPPTEVPEKKRRAISAEGKARIAAAQKKRWAAVRKKRD